MDQQNIDHDLSMARGLNFLQSRQAVNGKFNCYMSNNDELLHDEPSNKWAVPEEIVFTSILIGNSLLFLKKLLKADHILEKITSFLLSQRKTGSVWNHFIDTHYLYRLCPFDTDDTALASGLLREMGVGFPSNDKLLSGNRNRKKLYYTWFTMRFSMPLNSTNWFLSIREYRNPFKSFMFWRSAECERYDIDAVVNANMLYYSGTEKGNEAVTGLLRQIINENREGDCDKWYRNPLTVYYFFTRNYFVGIAGLGSIRKPIIDRITAMVMPNGSVNNNPLDTALAICSLLNLNDTSFMLGRAVQYLQQNQLEDGSWQKRCMYYGGPKKLVCFGSEELVTAFCLEAIARFNQS